MKIGFVGLGTMGTPMVSNIISKLDNQVFVYDLNDELLKLVGEKGVSICSSSSDVASKCDVIITMVPKSEHVVSVYNEFFKVDCTNKIFIDMSTISPEVSIKVSKDVISHGGFMLDCPVVKSQPAAVSGQLGIYVGGEHSVYSKVKFILECMGSNIIHLGENGSGLVMKLCHNMLVGQIQNGVNEMICLAGKCSGINPSEFAKAMSYGGAQNFYLDVKNQSIENKDFKAAFSIANMHKDVHLAKELMNSKNLDLKGINLVCDVYDEALNLGLETEDFCATIKVIDEEYRG